MVLNKDNMNRLYRKFVRSTLQCSQQRLAQQARENQSKRDWKERRRKGVKKRKKKKRSCLDRQQVTEDPLSRRQMQKKMQKRHGMQYLAVSIISSYPLFPFGLVFVHEAALIRSKSSPILYSNGARGCSSPRPMSLILYRGFVVCMAM